MLSTEINHAIGQDAVLVHHVFQDAMSLVDYFSKTASQHAKALFHVARPDIHRLRGIEVTKEVEDALLSKNVPVSFGEYLFGYVKNDYNRTDPANAIQVTAKWTFKEGESLDELIHWWKQVGTDVYSLEDGLVRFEVFRVIG